MPISTFMVSHSEIAEARERCRLRGLPDPGSIRIAKARRFWDAQCAARGTEITAVLEPFYACHGSFPLNPPVTDLDEAASRAVFWREIAGTVTVERIETAIETMGTTIQAQPTEVFASLPGSLTLEVAESKRDELGNYLWQRLPQHLWDEVGSGAWVGIEDHVDDAQREAAFDWVWGGLAKTLFVTVAFCLAKEADTVRPLLDLWLSGNWPLGFTRDRALIVYCAAA